MAPKLYLAESGKLFQTACEAIRACEPSVADVRAVRLMSGGAPLPFFRFVFV